MPTPEICSSLPASSSGEEQLSSLAFVDANTSLLCCTAGQLCVADIRQHSPLQAAPIPSAQRGQCWCMAVGRRALCSELSSQPIACLSSAGQLVLMDVRKASQCLASAKCRVPTSSCSAEFLSVSWAPALEGCLAVSGGCSGQKSPFLDVVLVLFCITSACF